MEVYEKINLLLKEKNLTKKEFSLKIIDLEPKLKSTGEIPTLKTMYTYLSGHIGLKIELIPYIAEVLDISEQVLFDDSSRAKLKFVKYIASSMSLDEEQKIKAIFCKDVQDEKLYNYHKDYSDILALLEYASPAHLKKIKSSLEDFKAITDKFS